MEARVPGRHVAGAPGLRVLLRHHTDWQPKGARWSPSRPRSLPVSICFAAFLAVVAAGCPSRAPNDASALDVGRIDGGETCSGPDGSTMCSGGYGATCCHGYLWRFADGPCWPRGADAPSGLDAAGIDAGNPCDVEPTRSGCPCTTEGEVDCGFVRWRRECEDGTWHERVGLVCC